MKTALLVVDAQNVYTNRKSEMYCKDSTGTIKRINTLINTFKKKRWPVFLIRHVHRADGSDLGRMFDYTGEPEEDFNFKTGTSDVEYDSRLHRPKGGFEIVKTRYSAFTGTGLDKKLKNAHVNTVVVCGFMTNFCCESTAREAHDLDYFVDFIVDATGTPGTDNLIEKKIRKIVAELLGAGFARISTTKEFLKTIDR
jgi:nicotinamidase-related amidase